jgi:hypothetical protein
MPAHKAARIRQLSGSLRVEEPLPPRIPLESCFRVENISQDDKALAESSLKRRLRLLVDLNISFEESSQN